MEGEGEGEGEGSLLSGQWKEKEKEKFICLVANGRRKRRFFATYSNFSPKQLYLNLHFYPLTFRFYFTMVLGHYFPIPFLSLANKL